MPSNVTDALLKQKSQNFDLETIFRLSLHDVGLSTADGVLNECTSLRSLDLSKNRITEVNELDGSALSRLEELDLSSNRLDSLRSFPEIPSLLRLQLQENKLATLNDVCSVLAKKCPDLQLLWLQDASGKHGNPVCGLPNYRAQVHT